LVMFHAHHHNFFIAHPHEVLTVILVTEGRVLIEVDENPVEVSGGELVLIGAHQVHAARPANAGGWSMRSTHLPAPQLFREDHRNECSLRPTAFKKPVHRAGGKVVQLFSDMHRCSETDAGLNEQTDRQQEFLYWLRRNLSDFDPQETRYTTPDATLERARDLISKAAFNNTYIDFIAEEIGISTFALNRLFKKNYGLSPHEWRMQIRAREAAKLLAECMPPADVAVTCGFTDQSHMGRIFKKVFGVTPGQYSLMQ
jgi:AraC-like DNA-binding protein